MAAALLAARGDGRADAGVGLPAFGDDVGGALLYVVLQRGLVLHEHQPGGWTGKRLFDRAVAGLLRSAGLFVRRFDNGSLQRSAALLVGSALVAAAWPFLGAMLAGGNDDPVTGSRALLPGSAPAVVVWCLLLGAVAALVAGHRDRLRAIVLTGAVGLVTALAFVALSAPNLALTQLAVGVVSTALLLMALALLPPTSPRESSPRRRGRDAALALAGGDGIGWLAWQVLTRDHDSIAGYFVAHALPGGGGSNVVNVILVDFRCYDTFGEITVLGIAAVGVLALLDGLRMRRPASDADCRAWSSRQSSALLRVAARVVLPLALVVSAFIFWRGHNFPGGGFVAGLVTAVAAVCRPWPAAGRRAAARPWWRTLRPLGRHGAGAGGPDRHRRLCLRPAIPDQRLRRSGAAAAGRIAAGQRRAVRPGRLPDRRRRDDADAVGAGRGEQAGGAGGCRFDGYGGGRGMISMEVLVASGIGCVTAGGIYLLLRAPRDRGSRAGLR